MPKPFLLSRSSGLFVRFNVPLDLQAVVGRECLVRSLRGLRGDHARLVAARLGYALAQAFDRLRANGADMDIKKTVDAALAAADRGEHRPYEVIVPGVGTIRADSPEDHARALEALAAMRVAIPGLAPGQAPAAFATAAPSSAPMLRASAGKFLEHCRSLKKSPATLLETDHSVRLFCDLNDDMPMASVGVDQIDAFRATLAVWPARARVLPEYRGLTARQIIAKAKRKAAERGPGLGLRTVEKHLDRLRTFFNWAVQRREMPPPLSGLRLQSTAAKYAPTRRGFRVEELAALFDPARRTDKCADDPHYFWIPTVALFTGARQGEIAQLTLTDLDQVAGVWGVDITSESSKSLKNAQSRRFIPLPDRLLALGLLDYALDLKAQGTTELFPGGSVNAKNGLGDRISKWFNRTYLRKSCELTDPEICFHSFRHTFLSAADRLGISESQVGALTGHAARSVQARHYIDAATVPERKERIDRNRPASPPSPQHQQPR
jgi:integrase